TSGNVKWNLTLADGTRVAQKTTLSKSGAWPLYAEPYRNGGLVIGWMQFGSNALAGFSGGCAWAKSSGISPSIAGFNKPVSISGSLFKAPPFAYRAFGPAKIIFTGGDLSAAFTNSVTWGMDNKVVNHSGNSLSLSV